MATITSLKVVRTGDKTVDKVNFSNQIGKSINTELFKDSDLDYDSMKDEAIKLKNNYSNNNDGTTESLDLSDSTSGSINGFYYANTNLFYDTENDRYFRQDAETGAFLPISIFDEENLDSSQFGANQMDFEWHFAELIEDPLIWDELQQYYPVESFASEDEAMDFYQRYFQVITDNGCGYAAGVNIIFKEYEGREKEFEDTFGFPMYTVSSDGKVDFNYELMLLKYFDYCWAGKYSLEDMENDDVSRGFLADKGVYCDLETLDDFLATYGVQCDSDMDNINRFAYWSSNEKHNNKTQELCEENDYVIYDGNGWSIEADDGTVYSGGGHFLTIVGFTDDGRPIVSSWGNRYILDINGEDLDLFEEDKFRYICVNFE